MKIQEINLLTAGVDLGLVPFFLVGHHYMIVVLLGMFFAANLILWHLIKTSN